MLHFVPWLLKKFQPPGDSMYRLHSSPCLCSINVLFLQPNPEKATPIQMKPVLNLLFILCVFSGCSSAYYLCQVDEKTPVYNTKDDGKPAFSLSPGRHVLAQGNKAGYRKIKLGNYQGYIENKQFPVERRFSGQEVKQLSFTKDSLYTYKNSRPASSSSKLKSGNWVQ